MKRFIIKVSTNWCEMNDSFRAVADEEWEEIGGEIYGEEC